MKRSLKFAALLFFFVALPIICSSDDSHLPAERDMTPSSSERIAPEQKYPIEIPPASEVLPRLRKMTDSKPPIQEKKVEESPQAKMLRQLMSQGGGYAVLNGPQCFRSVPTREEFLDMVKNNPADANQILQQCNVDLRDISPLPQLPSGTRQLPEDTRQRPVQSWGGDYSHVPADSPGSRLELGLNLKTHKLEPYYNLDRFGNTSLGIRLGLGRHNLNRYYKTAPSN